MDIKGVYNVKHEISTSFQHELWPLDEIDPKKGRWSYSRLLRIQFCEY
uniref:Uncharacterized protein n=1 Tax=Rhizophora mucronata TaxID=61149 RepID=A0A2P2JDA0_RHIMU